MEDLWKRAKLFAEEAAKKSQTLTTSSSSKIADLVSETAKKSKEIALEASKRADQLRSETAKKSKEIADQIPFKSISDIIPPQLSSSLASIANADVTTSSSTFLDEGELKRFGITDDLREFVKGLTSSTFQNFPVQDEQVESDVPTTTSNVRKDLTEWQERHATIVLSIIKQISRLRYDLCPRVMKERRFWRIYFTLVSTHVGLYERQYVEEAKRKAEEQKKEHIGKNSPATVDTSGTEGKEKNLKSKVSSASSEQDLDTFLLGDLEDSDGGQDDDGNVSFDDDFDKIENSDVEEEKNSNKMPSTTS